jgi:cellulose synthase/poly-beta-1,6-N-acetylglucosamine synthase-like glycosyltransferase
MLVVLICDGHERIPESFKKLARDKQFLDEHLLAARGFMTQDKDGQLKMKQIKDLMDRNVPESKHPTNLLHLFQLTSMDFGIKDDSLKSHRINFMFGLKHRNDGKINSHKWFFQGICKFLKPDFTLLLDIGTKPMPYSVVKLYQHMLANPRTGGCCGEIEVDLEGQSMATPEYWLQVA